MPFVSSKDIFTRLRGSSKVLLVDTRRYSHYTFEQSRNRWSKTSCDSATSCPVDSWAGDFLDRVAHGSDDSFISVKEPNTNRKLFLWPMAAIVLAAFAAVNPFYQPDISPFIGCAAWLGDMALAIVCFVYPPLARPGVLLCGLFLAVPCFLNAGPLFRGCLILSCLLPLLVAAVPLLAPSITDFRARLYFLMSWFGTRELKRRPRLFHAAALMQSVAGTLAFAAMVAVVQAIPASGLWFGPRSSPAG